jgi:hypothetical protein
LKQSRHSRSGVARLLYALQLNLSSSMGLDRINPIFPKKIPKSWQWHHPKVVDVSNSRINSSKNW